MASRIIRRGTGLIAGSPGATGRPARVTVPTPSPARKVTPLPGAAGTHRRKHQGAVGHVRIVAGILDDAGGRRRCVLAVDREREGRTLAARQGHLDRIGKLAGEQRRIGRLGGRGGAGAGGPAPAERTGLRAHDPAYSPRATGGVTMERAGDEQLERIGGAARRRSGARARACLAGRRRAGRSRPADARCARRPLAGGCDRARRARRQARSGARRARRRGSSSPASAAASRRRRRPTSRSAWSSLRVPANGCCGSRAAIRSCSGAAARKR